MTGTMKRLRMYVRGLPTSTAAALSGILACTSIAAVGLARGMSVGSALAYGVVLGLLCAATEVAWRSPVRRRR